MADRKFNPKNSGYVEVSERIADFRAAHPEGSLQSEVIRWPGEGYAFIVVKAYAYRSPSDERPGIGHAAEPFPGRTPYTNESELMNAETSAWGRAIVAVGASDSRRGVASANELRNRNTAPTPVGAGSQPTYAQDAAGTPATGSGVAQHAPGRPAPALSPEGGNLTATAPPPSGSLLALQDEAVDKFGNKQAVLREAHRRYKVPTFDQITAEQLREMLLV